MPAASAVAQCGTNAAYVAHRKRRERACEACLAAHRIVTARSSIVHGRAQRRLARLYPEVFAALLAEESAKYDKEQS